MTSPRVQQTYRAIGDEERTVPGGTARALADALGEAAPDPKPDPAKAYAPPALGGAGLWGVALQLYAMRSRRNWGIGDFTDLAALLGWARGLGADYLGVNPLHALPYAAPERRSPYYPSSRLALNVLTIDPDAAADTEGTAFGDDVLAARDAARAGDLIAYEAVARAKHLAFEALFAAFEANADAKRRAAFDAFRASDAVRGHAVFEALSEAHGTDVSAWPEALRDPGGEAARAQADTPRARFHAYLQWTADAQLRAAVAAGGGETTLYLDLAVGAAADGSEAWAGGDLFARSVRLGAPPDPMAMSGQDWGLPPMNPNALVHADFAPLRAMLAASMRHAGALRIDHVLGFDRQFWIPEGATAAEGGYVSFPRDGMIAAAAASSRENACLVVGEDLGTVPEGLTEALHAAGILSYEVARWARDEAGAFMEGADYPRLCLAVATTHDVAPIAGWLTGRDLADRAAAENRDVTEEERATRAEERDGLLKLWGVTDEAPRETVVLAAHDFLARSKAGVVMAALEDVLLQEVQVNMPGTTDEYPNWRVRYARNLEDWTKDEGVAALASAAARRLT